MSLAAAVAVVTGASGSAGTRPARVDAVAQVRALANAMYPSLVGRGLRARVASDLYVDTDPLPLSSFLYSITSDSDEDPKALLVADVFSVDDAGMIRICGMVGDFVNTARNNAIRRSLETDTEWSEARDERALRDAGAEFGPWNRAGFLAQTLPRLEALGPAWGGLAEWTAEFEMRYHGGGQAAPVVWWRMIVHLRSTDGTRRYRLLFEPFEGKLVHLQAE